MKEYVEEEDLLIVIKASEYFGEIQGEVKDCQI